MSASKVTRPSPPHQYASIVSVRERILSDQIVMDYSGTGFERNKNNITVNTLTLFTGQIVPNLLHLYKRKLCWEHCYSFIHQFLKFIVQKIYLVYVRNLFNIW